MVGPTINLISETYHSCEKKKYAFIILQKYTIISLAIAEAKRYKAQALYFEYKCNYSLNQLMFTLEEILYPKRSLF